MNVSNIFQAAVILQTSASSQSALEAPIRKATEARADLYFILLLISSGLVAVGILFEWPEVKHAFLEWRRSKPSLERNRIPLWGLIGFVLVAIGVGAEGVFEGLVGIKDTKLRDLDKTAIADTELRASKLEQSNLTLQVQVDSFQGQIADANARAKASEAKVAAAEAEAKQAEARVAAAEAESKDAAAKVATADARIAEADRAAAEANAKAEEERLARVRLEDRMGGWRLSIEAQSNIDGKLKPFAGTPFDFAVNPNEAVFMETLDSMLTSPNVAWIRQPPKQDNALMAILINGKASIIFASGIILEIDEDRWSTRGEAFVALGNALQAEGIVVTAHKVPAGSWGDRIHIIVGKRE